MAAPRVALPAEVLAALRDRRAAQRAAQRHVDVGAPRVGFVQTLRSLLTTGDASGSAQAFVASMNASQREVEDAHDAFLLDPGMGPMTYLTSDGRVLFDMATWDGGTLVEANDELEVIQALVAGAEKTGIKALLGCLPPPPADARTCECCKGRRAILVPSARPAEERAPRVDTPVRVLCFLCAGRGWITDAILDEVRARGQQWPIEGWTPDPAV